MKGGNGLYVVHFGLIFGLQYAFLVLKTIIEKFLVLMAFGASSNTRTYCVIDYTILGFMC